MAQAQGMASKEERRCRERENVSVFQESKTPDFRKVTTKLDRKLRQDLRECTPGMEEKYPSKTGEGADTMDFFSVYSTTPFKMPAGSPRYRNQRDANAEATVHVLSRIAGEKVPTVLLTRSDYYLRNDDEYQILADICAYYKNVIVHDQCRRTGGSFLHG